MWLSVHPAKGGGKWVPWGDVYGPESPAPSEGGNGKVATADKSKTPSRRQRSVFGVSLSKSDPWPQTGHQLHLLTLFTMGFCFSPSLTCSLIFFLFQLSISLLFPFYSSAFHHPSLSLLSSLWTSALKFTCTFQILFPLNLTPIKTTCKPSSLSSSLKCFYPVLLSLLMYYIETAFNSLLTSQTWSSSYPSQWRPPLLLIGAE